ncbi:hypothetical protein I9S53_12940 [Hyphomicrobium sulfonivorans]|nr:hypothetical protein [Hyphomicrobium sulfonivorans]
MARRRSLAAQAAALTRCGPASRFAPTRTARIFAVAIILIDRRPGAALKDGHPFPVQVKVYDETLRVLKSAVERARLGNDETMAALRRLDAQARLLEGAVSGPSLDAFVAQERSASIELEGRSVFGWEHERAAGTRGFARR